ncbi:hypothetical protein [Luteitalea sp. TBR-22]|uniref:DUF6946 family protein n=1 Tax=Luteitalea sp. TBR-22 TaxID=2802971 RepID=UPI001EF55C5C|nr:hypothetical protein [Luteitalea sp. TBR-22]
MTWSIHTRLLDTHTDVVGGLAPDSFDKVTRSTIPLLDYWREPAARLDSLTAQLGWPPFSEAELSFERQVPVANGKGKASFTDLMILGDQGAIAIEAKYTEPPYETVAEWLAQGNQANRALVLDGWLARIGEATGTAVARPGVAALPYQLIHRAASACSVASARRAVVYQVFDDKHLQHYQESLRTFAGCLTPSSTLSLGVLLVPARLMPETPRSLNGNALRDGLRGMPVYAFEEASWFATTC